MSTDLITIATFFTPTEAGISQGMLEAAGIESSLLNENAAGMGYWGTRVELQVAARDAEGARALLKPESAAPNFQAADASACPQCGSTRKDAKHRNSFAAIVLSFFSFFTGFFWATPAWLRSRWHCDECGHDWRAGR